MDAVFFILNFDSHEIRHIDFVKTESKKGAN